MAWGSIPDEWRYAPPESLVAGNGPYAAALAAILGTVAVPFDRLQAGPEPDSEGAYPQVLENLIRTFLVVTEAMSPRETLRCHHSLWNWVEKLSSAGDQHDLAFLFVLPALAGEDYEKAIAIGLSFPSLDPATTGHAAWRQSGSLVDLLDLTASINPMDRMALTARERSDGRRMALAQLRDVLPRCDAPQLQAAVRAVLAAFRQEEYHLDLFCRAPSHHHGNLLRRWLNEGVTGSVTQDWCTMARIQVARWLAEDDENRFA